MKNIITIHFQAWDYCEKDHVKISSINPRPNSFSEKELVEALFNDLRERHVTSNIQSNSDIYIGINPTRINKEDKLDSILTVFSDGRERIGGVIGIVVGTLPSSNKENIVYDKNKKEIEIHYHLSIKSRYDPTTNNKSFFAATLLTYGIPGKLNNRLSVWDEDSLYDFVLIGLWADYLKKAKTNGTYRTYQCFEGNDDKIRGSIDISKHIKFNAGQDNGRIAYKYRENTTNNTFNAFIVYTYEHIKKKYPEFAEQFIDSSDLGKYIAELRCVISYSGFSKKELFNNALKPITHPFFIDYELVRIVSWKILRDEGVNLFDASSKNEQIRSFVFYIPDLWENYLFQVLKECENICDQWEVKDQYDDLYFIEDKNDKGSYMFQSRPDYVFRNTDIDDDRVFMILDAKMKPVWSGIDKSNKGMLKDIGEDINKCIRDMVVNNAHSTGVVYPVSEEELVDTDPISHELRISEINENDRFYAIPFPIKKVNDKDNYQNWKTNFDRMVNQYKPIICRLISSAQSNYQ